MRVFIEDCAGDSVGEETVATALDVDAIPCLYVGLSKQRRRKAYPSPLSHAEGQVGVGEYVLVKKRGRLKEDDAVG